MGYEVANQSYKPYSAYGENLHSFLGKASHQSFFIAGEPNLKIQINIIKLRRSFIMATNKWFQGNVSIDVIKEISTIRNNIETIALIMQEKNQYFSDMKMLLENSKQSINNIHRWFLRNPHALENFNNAIAFYDGDIEPITYSKGKNNKKNSIA